MTRESWSAERTELLAAIADLLATPAGTAVLVLVVALFIGALALSGLLLVQLGRRARTVSLPAPSWNGLDVIACLLGWYSIQAVAYLLADRVAKLAPGDEATVRIVCQSLAILAFAVALLLLPRLHGQSQVALGLGSGSVKNGIATGVITWACALPGLFAVLIGTNILLLLLGVTPDEQLAVEIFKQSITEKEHALAVAILVFGVAVAPLVEELLFRAVLHRWLSARFGIAAGAVISGVAFGLVHGSLFALAPISLLGVLLALLLERTGNLWSCITLHAVFNAGSFALMLVLADAAR